MLVKEVDPTPDSNHIKNWRLIPKCNQEKSIIMVSSWPCRVSTTHLKIRYAYTKSTGIPSSNQLKWLEKWSEYQLINPGNNHEGCLPNEVNLVKYVSECRLFPDNKVHGANMGPIWGRQDPGRPHVVPMNFVIWVHYWVPRTGNYLNQWWPSWQAHISWDLLDHFWVI